MFSVKTVSLSKDRSLVVLYTMPLDCPACGKTYVSASRYYTAHVSKCSGGVRATTPSPAPPAPALAPALAPAALAAPAAASLAAPRTGLARRAVRLAASTLAIVAVSAYALVALAVAFPDQQALLICVNWAPALLPWLLGDSFAYPVYGIGLAASDPANGGRPTAPSRAGLHMTRSLRLPTADGETLGLWHTVPVSSAGATVRRRWSRRSAAWVGRNGGADASGEQQREDFNAALLPSGDFGGALVVLFLHGNGESRSKWIPTSHCRLLSSTLGCHCLLLDYRGFADSTGHPTEAGLITDARTVVSWLVEERGVAAHRIVLWGHSLGTGVATALAGELEGEEAVLRRRQEESSAGAEGGSSEVEETTRPAVQEKGLEEGLEGEALALHTLQHGLGSAGGDTINTGKVSSPQLRSYLGGLVLEAPFTSIPEVVLDHPTGFIFRALPFAMAVLRPRLVFQFNTRRTLRRLGHLTTMVLHGERDFDIPVRHGEQLYHAMQAARNGVFEVNSNAGERGGDGGEEGGQGGGQGGRQGDEEVDGGVVNLVKKKKSYRTKKAAPAFFHRFAQADHTDIVLQPGLVPAAQAFFDAVEEERGGGGAEGRAGGPVQVKEQRWWD